MPLLDREDKTPVEAFRVMIRADLNAQLSAYADMTESTRNYVVSAALAHVFGVDKEFKEFWKTNRHKYLTTAATTAKAKAATGGK